MDRLRRTGPGTARAAASGARVDVENYVPALLTWIANKLSRGASQHYLAAFGVGIEVWRCLVQLAGDGSASAQHVSRVVGMDKASVSRCFKTMHARGLIAFEPDHDDRRVRLAALTARGRELHDRIVGVALEREQAFLSVLGADEQRTLIALLRRLHEHLPDVERATERSIARRSPETRQRGVRS